MPDVMDVVENADQVFTANDTEDKITNNSDEEHTITPT